MKGKFCIYLPDIFCQEAAGCEGCEIGKSGGDISDEDKRAFLLMLSHIEFLFEAEEARLEVVLRNLDKKMGGVLL